MLRKAQSTLEYAALMAVVVGALVTMQVYFKRGVEGKVRSTSDDIGTQFDLEKGGYIRQSKLEGQKVNVTVTGDSTLMDEQVGDSETKRYTEADYTMKTGEKTTTDESATLDILGN
ncbi:MAG: hypothetical protein K9L61_00630 [Candidatus Omnitrophica bacterium]|nr:hypothetical protein [Candidatus Omnitrophota bacterium]